jgi:predicted metalloprotease with PDZ domain
MQKTFRITVIAAAILTLALSLLAVHVMAKTKRTGWLGVYTDTVTERDVQRLNLEKDYGAKVDRVIEGTAAEEAGLKEDDVIISVGDYKIYDSEDLREEIDSYQPGDEVTITYIRDGRQETVTAKLGRKPRSEPGSYSFYNFSDDFNVDAPNVVFHKVGYIGVQIDNLTDQLGEYFGVEDGEGALVSAVEEDSPAAAAGLKAGDVIVGVNDEKVRDRQDAIEIIRDYEEGDQITIHVLRDKDKKDLTVTVGETEDFMYGLLGPDLPGVPAVPAIPGFTRGDSRIYLDIDREELRKEIEEARREYKDAMREVKEQLKEMQKELRDLRDER